MFSRSFFSTLFLLLTFTANSLSSETTRYEHKHSFKPPFYLLRSATIPFWNFGGSTVITQDNVRITPDLGSRKGWIVNTQPIDFDAWEIDMVFQVGAPKKKLGADGFAFWYIEQKEQSFEEGDVFGGPAKFNGLAVFFDTFDNDQSGNNPYISAHINDGSKTFTTEPDTIPGGYGCRANNLRQDNKHSRAVITYSNRRLKVELDLESSGTLTPCIEMDAELPKGYYFAISAATGGLSDIHDIYSFKCTNLAPETLPSHPPKPTEPEPNTQSQHQTTQQPVQSHEKLIPIPIPNTVPPQIPQQQQQQQQQQPPAPTYQPTAPTYQPTQPQQPSQPYQPLSYQQPSQPYVQPCDLSSTAEQLKNVINYLNSMGSKVTSLETGNDALRKELAQLSQKYEEIMTQLRTINSGVNSMKDVNNKIDGIRNELNVVKNSVERTHQVQNDFQTVLKKNFGDVLQNIQESSSGFGFWFFFLICQVLFGVGYVMYKKWSDDRIKKLF